MGEYCRYRGADKKTKEQHHNTPRFHPHFHPHKCGTPCSFTAPEETTYTTKTLFLEGKWDFSGLSETCLIRRGCPFSWGLNGLYETTKDLIRGLFRISTHTSTHTIDGKHSDPPRPGYDRKRDGPKTISFPSSYPSNDFSRHIFFSGSVIGT